MRGAVKKYFITGFLIVVPLYVTAYIFMLFVNFFDSVVPKSLRPDAYLGFHLPGLGIIITVVVVFLVGFIATNFLGDALVKFGEGLLGRIPFLRTIYKSTKQFLETFFSEKGEGFKKVALIEFPRKGIYSIGFITSTAKGEVQEKTKERTVGVFIPTTPNPTTGFYLAVPETDLILLDMSVEDAFKVIMSAGIIYPPYAVKQEGAGAK